MAAASGPCGVGGKIEHLIGGLPKSALSGLLVGLILSGCVVACGQSQEDLASQRTAENERFVTPYESGVYINECMAREGIVTDAEVDAYGGISGDITGVDPEWELAVFESCVIEAEEVGMAYNPVATPELTSAFYDFLLELGSCLEGEGYEVSEPPSRDLFVESRGEAWHPYEAIVESGLSPLTINQIEEVCPSVPLSLEP